MSSSSIASVLTLFSVLSFASSPAMAQAADIHALPASAETCVAMFTVAAYAYADDDFKERQLEEKRALAKAAMQPEAAAVGADLQASDERIQQTMDILTGMMLDQPAQAQVIAKDCFRQYPPDIELN